MTIQCEQSIPLLHEEGWTRHLEDDAKLPVKERTGWSLTESRYALSDHPVCGIKVGFAEIFLMPQPPLLHEEGNKSVLTSALDSFTRSKRRVRVELRSSGPKGLSTQYRQSRMTDSSAG